MSLPTILEPENARLTIPIVLAIGYALYHWRRWRRMHPRIVIEKLPKPASTLTTVKPTGGAEPSSESPSPAPASPASASPAPSSPARAAGTPDVARPQGRARQRTKSDFLLDEERLEIEASDIRYISNAFRRARRGHLPEYFVRLGEYAWYRGAMVEAHFWMSLATSHGVQGLESWQALIRQNWKSRGYPRERSNFYEHYSRETSRVAYAFICACVGLEREGNLAYVEAKAAEGDEDARRLLSIPLH